MDTRVRAAVTAVAALAAVVAAPTAAVAVQGPTPYANYAVTEGDFEHLSPQDQYAAPQGHLDPGQI